MLGLDDPQWPMPQPPDGKRSTVVTVLLVAVAAA